MEPVKLADGVYWVGAVDWDIREFHGLGTPQGSTYNSYLIVDEKTVLIDTVKSPETETLLGHVSKIIDPVKIDYVISNHSEYDHSGSLGRVMEAAPGATLIASKDGVKRLEQMFHQDWNFQAVADGEELSLGGRTLRFIYAPLLHWPETMFSYCPEDRILFSCDAFGGHVATTERFSDKLGVPFVMPYTRSYYAFLLAAFRRAAAQVMGKIAGLDIDMIGPSHGPIWRGKDDLAALMEAYRAWTSLELEDRAVIIYGTMWGNTGHMVEAVAEGVSSGGLEARAFNVQLTDPSEIIAGSFISKLIMFGSPTFESGIYPPVEAFIPYLRVPRDKHKKIAVFGSYGWSGGSIPKLTQALTAEGYEVMEEGLKVRFTPTSEELDACREFGRRAAEWARERLAADAAGEAAAAERQ